MGNHEGQFQHITLALASFSYLFSYKAGREDGRTREPVLRGVIHQVTRRLLNTMQESQALQLATRDRLVVEIAALDVQASGSRA